MNSSFSKTNYSLMSVKTGKSFDDKGWTLDAPDETEPTLIRAIYEKKQLEELQKLQQGYLEMAQREKTRLENYAKMEG